MHSTFCVLSAHAETSLVALCVSFRFIHLSLLQIRFPLLQILRIRHVHFVYMRADNATTTYTIHCDSGTSYFFATGSFFIWRMPLFLPREREKVYSLVSMCSQHYPETKICCVLLLFIPAHDSFVPRHNEMFDVCVRGKRSRFVHLSHPEVASQRNLL